MREMIEIDGAYGEGGGAIVRVGLALSVLSGVGVKFSSIRAGRPTPGLKAQHLTVIKALKEMCSAKTNDVELGVEEFWFVPEKMRKGTYSFDIGTAGSISLFLQGVLLPAMFATGKVTLNIKGGTCGKWQASVDYIQNLLFPQLRRFVDKLELKVLKRGYYPKGGGEVVVEVSPRFNLTKYESLGSLLEELSAKLCKIKLVEQGKLQQVRGVVNVSSELVDAEVGERIQRAASAGFEVPVNVRVDYAKTLNVGGEVLLWGVFGEGGVDFDNPVLIGSSGLLDKRKSSEELGKEVARMLQKEMDSECAVDEHLADQLVMFMGLLPGSIIKTSSVSDHVKSNVYVVEKFLDIGFKIEKNMISAHTMQKV